MFFGNVAEACYVTPCYEGPGLEELWKVNKGITFTGKSLGLFSLFHAALGYALFANRRGNNEPEEEASPTSLFQHAHFVVGIFAGITLCVSLLSLNMVYVWGAETNLLLNLEKLKVTNGILYESGRHMMVNRALADQLLRLSSVCSFMCFVQLLIFVQLLLSKKEFIQYFRLLVINNNDSSSGGGGREMRSVMSRGGDVNNNNNSDDESAPLMTYQSTVNNHNAGVAATTTGTNTTTTMLMV